MMNWNVKIAKQLIRIAKGLIEDTNITITNDGKSDYSVNDGNIAGKPGKYKNFTGMINWHGTVGNVKNATFELKKESEIISWRNGLWESGKWEHGVWYDGTWESGYWESGTWYDGTWKDGVWESGEWYDGLWKDGVWENGVWGNGTWKKGIWKKGKWYDGVWESGVWENGKDGKNNSHSKGDSPDKWQK